MVHASRSRVEGRLGMSPKLVGVFVGFERVIYGLDTVF
jgi:hypothetical protein